VLIVGEELGPELADALADRAELDLEVVPPGPAEERGSARWLGSRMVELERLATDHPPDAVVIAASGAEAAAAALALSKLEIPIARVAAGEEDDAMIAERLSELILGSDEAALARLRRAGLGERSRLAGAPTSDDAVRALAAWVLSRSVGS
jgi:UDP-N-acetylglucosamine 2-epimerase